MNSELFRCEFAHLNVRFAHMLEGQGLRMRFLSPAVP